MNVHLNESVEEEVDPFSDSIDSNSHLDIVSNTNLPTKIESDLQLDFKSKGSRGILNNVVDQNLTCIWHQIYEFESDISSKKEKKMTHDKPDSTTEFLKDNDIERLGKSPKKKLYKSAPSPKTLVTPKKLKGDASKKKKRLRRTASEILRNWKCVFCNKSYGSEGALKTHCKLKHPSMRRLLESDMTSPINQTPLNSLRRHYPMTTVASSLVPLPVDVENPYEKFSSHNVIYPKHNFVLLNQHYSSDVNAPPRDVPIKDLYIYQNYSGIDKPNYSDKSNGMAYPHSKNLFDPIVNEFPTNLNNPSNLIPFLANTKPNPNSSSSPILEQLNSVIPVLVLKIGEFVKSSTYSGDIVACISFVERCFFWDIMWINSIVRIEIPFDEIEGLSLDFKEDNLVVFSIQLSRPPKFWSGSMIPHQDNQWCITDDFTNGYARKFKRHILHFLQNELLDILPKLYEHEPSLCLLIQKALSKNDDPIFEINMPYL